MKETEIISKYNELTDEGKLPLVFKNVIFEDAETNHELRNKSYFYSPKFNTRNMVSRYIERAFIY